MTINAVAVSVLIQFLFHSQLIQPPVVDPEWPIPDPDLTSSTFPDPDPTQGHIYVSLEVRNYSYICSVEIHLDPDSCRT
jgi:hypothetical protein